MKSFLRSAPDAARAALVAAALLFAGCGDDAPSGAAAQGTGERSFRVEMAKAGTRDIEITIDAVGTAYASGQVDIRPQVSGILLAAPFVEGDHAEKGQLLAQLDDSKPRASLALAEAHLDSARAKLEVATERLGRARRLAAEELVSREEFSTLESEQKAAAAAVREHEAEVQLARRNLEDYALKAPISGRMGIRRVDVGNFIEAGTIISTLVETDPLEVLFTVPSAAMDGIAIGQPAEIRETDASQALVGHGKVRVIDPRVDTETRMVSVKALVPNPDQKLKAGQFVGVRLVREKREAAVVIPEDAIIPYAGKTFVYVVDGDQASRREITLGQRLPEAVEVRSGLRAGETIVTRGQHRLGEGARVEEQKSSRDADAKAGTALKPGEAPAAETAPTGSSGASEAGKG